MLKRWNVSLCSGANLLLVSRRVFSQHFILALEKIIITPPYQWQVVVVSMVPTDVLRLSGWEYQGTEAANASHAYAIPQVFCIVIMSSSITSMSMVCQECMVIFVFLSILDVWRIGHFQLSSAWTCKPLHFHKSESTGWKMIVQCDIIFLQSKEFGEACICWIIYNPTFPTSAHLFP